MGRASGAISAEGAMVARAARHQAELDKTVKDIRSRACRLRNCRRCERQESVYPIVGQVVGLAAALAGAVNIQINAPPASRSRAPDTNSDFEVYEFALQEILIGPFRHL